MAALVFRNKYFRQAYRGSKITPKNSFCSDLLQNLCEGAHIGQGCQAGISFQKTKFLPGLQGVENNPPKIHFAPIPSKICVKVRIYAMDVKAALVFRKPSFCQAYRGSKITPQKFILLRSPPKFV